MVANGYTHWMLSLINIMVAAIIGKALVPSAPTDQVQSFESMTTAREENNKKELEAPFLKALDEHKGIIIKICRAYCNTRADEEDLYQEITYQLWKDYPSFLGNGKVSSWMYTVAMRTAILPYRDKSQKVKIELREELPDLPVEDETIQADIMDTLPELFPRLSNFDRGLVTLIFEGYNKNEIGAILRLREETVKKRITRIRNKINKL